MIHLRQRCFAAFAITMCMALIGIAPAPAPKVDPSIVARAKEWLQRAQTGNIDRTQLSARANAMLTPEVVKGAAAGFAALGAPTKFSLIQSHASGSSSKDSMTTYDFLVSFPKGQFIWAFTVGQDGKIEGLFLSPYTSPAQHLGEKALIAALRMKLLHDSKAGDFAGAVLVARHGTPIFVQAYGFADRKNAVPNTPRTRFRIGSMNKMFTAVAIMQLVQAGKIDLNAPLGTYLPAYPNKDVASQVTIHQLLTHTGGTGDFFGPEFDKHRLELRTLDDYVKLFGDREPGFKPGSKFEYSNYGFILLGVVVEKVSGENYYDYVREHIYQPAGMTATGSDPENESVAERSIGYTVDNGKVHPNTDSLPYRGTSAGGGYSTVGDLLRFADALLAHKLLHAANTTLLTTGKVDMPTRPGVLRRYAYGFGDANINGTRCFGHDGGAPGMNGDLEICPEAGYIVAILANVDPPVADETANFIVSRLPQRKL